MVVASRSRNATWCLYRFVSPKSSRLLIPNPASTAAMDLRKSRNCQHQEHTQTNQTKSTHSALVEIVERRICALFGFLPPLDSDQMSDRPGCVVKTSFPVRTMVSNLF